MMRICKALFTIQSNKTLLISLKNNYLMILFKIATNQSSLNNVHQKKKIQNQSQIIKLFKKNLSAL